MRFLASELGASTCAPSSTPTDKRSTSSPPSQPVNSARPPPANESASAAIAGADGASPRSSQLGPEPLRARQTDEIEDNSSREQTERKHDQHLVNGMSEQLGAAFHVSLQ